VPVPLFPTPATVRVPPNTHGRDIAVGDIHGAFSALQDALRAVTFDTRCDRLFALGDLVDRGPESPRVMDWLAQPWFHAICGNHDYMIWRAALGQPFDYIDHRLYGGEWLETLPEPEQQRIGARLAQLPVVIEVETPHGVVGLVHADCPFDDWQEMHRIDWRGLDGMSSFAAQCLWSVDRFRFRYTGLVRNIHAVVHGHTTISGVARLGNCHFIDTGGWRAGGHFTLLDLHRLQPLNSGIR